MFIVILVALLLLCARSALAEVYSDGNSSLKRDSQVISQCVSCNVSYLLESRAEFLKSGKTSFNLAKHFSCDCRLRDGLTPSISDERFNQSQQSLTAARHCPIWLRHQSILR